VKAFAVNGSLESLQDALKGAYSYDGLSVLHVPVYAGTDERGGLGAYGSWNVGNWCESVQDTYLSSNI
jgi:3D-(3,5/4)-trihydroxycyclohexane-1,2-dione acylhydrolase (decyclizing)